MPMDRIELFVATAITGFLVMMVAIVWMMFEASRALRRSAERSRISLMVPRAKCAGW